MDGKTTGTEVWVKSIAGIRGDIATRICMKLAKIGFRNRGVKMTNNLYVLNHTTMPALLIEICFVSDPDDAKLYKANKDKVANAIVQAILDYNKLH